MDRKVQNLALFFALVFASCSLEGDVELLRPRPASAPEPVLSAPGLPTVISGDGMITARWAAVEEALSYEVYINVTGDEPLDTDTPNAVVYSTVAVFDNLVNKTVYYVWVKVQDATRSSDFSPRARGIPWPANEKPAAPGELTVIPGINQLTVIWEECGGASSYEAYISTSAAAPSTAEVVTNKTNAVIRELENGEIYYLWVRAVNSAGQSDYSPRAVGTPRVPTVAPAAPAMPVLVAGSRELAVSWQAVELAASYEVWFGTTGNSGTSEKFGSDVVDAEAVITGLTNETTYYVWIRAKNIIGTSGFSPPASAKPSAFAVLPETPEMPEVTPGSRALDVSWQAAEGALSYELWIGETDNPEGAVKRGEDISGASVTLNDLDNDKTYYIWIKAKNSIGESGFSPLASGTPSVFAAPPPAPQAAPTISAGSGQLTVSWQEAEGATAYEVWAGTSQNPTTAAKRGDDVTGLSAVVTGLTNGTTYYVWIKAKNSVGTSDLSPMASGMPSAFTVAPQAPAAPAVSIGNGQITVTWTAVEGATAYGIWLGTTNNSASAAQDGADESASLSRTIGGLSNGVTYYVWITAKNGVGTSGFSPAASGKPIANAAAPALTSGNEQLSATWAAIAGADQYEVFYGSGINPPQTASQTINAPATTATIADLVNGTSYNVWVRGKNTTGTGEMSAAASARPIGNMGAVTLASGNGQITANWSTVAGADQYEVYHSTTGSIPASPAQMVNAPATTATITGLTNGTTYYVFVIPKNAHGAGAVSAAASGAPMATPGALTISVANQQITLNWAAVLGAASYEVYQSTTPTIPVSPVDTAMTPNHTFTGLSNGTTYYFWVKAVNANGISEASPVASGKPIGNMGAVTLASGNEQLTASWAAVAGADEYEVYFDTTNAIPASPAQTVNATTATISGLSNGTTYYVWVKPKNANGVGSTSAVISGKPLGTPGVPMLNAGVEQISISWTDVPGADQYEVYYGIGNTNNLFATVSGTTATITGLVNGTTYTVRLRARNSTGVSSYGPTATAMPNRVGFYKGTIDNEHRIGSQNLATSLAYISANSISGDEYFIVLGTDESASTMNLDYSGKTVGIMLLGEGGERTINLDSTGEMFIINAGVTLTLDENITLIGLNTNYDSLVSVNSGELIINNGAKISGNSSIRGGGIGVGTSGTLIMNGGTISGNTAGMSSGIYVDGVFTMNGGTITGNTATISNSGGSIYVDNNGTLTMHGGTISGNTGAGIYIYGTETGTVTINGGTISGNTRGISGAGTVTMNDGTISGNTYAGIDSGYRGTVTMNGGTICENGGGGISGYTITIYNGTIRGNFSHGVYVHSTFTMNGGTISGNTASDYGGGIYVNPGTVTINGGIISGNTAGRGGGGIYFSPQYNSGTLTINGGTISGNTANGNGGYDDGGGIYVDRGTVTINDGTISGNTAGRGGGIFLNSSNATVTMNGGIISGNTANSGGGVFNDYGGIFKKLPNGGAGQNSGIIYGSEAVGTDIDGIPLRNTASSDTNGHAVYRLTSTQKRNTTANQTDQIDTTTGLGLSADGNPPYGP